MVAAGPSHRRSATSVRPNAAATAVSRPPVSTPGSYIALRAELDCVVAFSACPQDIIPINGTAMRPTEAHFEIIG